MWRDRPPISRTLELEPSVQSHVLELGERKEFLSQAEHDELMGLVDFTRKRTIEPLEAKRALGRVHDAFPGVDEVSSGNQDHVCFMNAGLALDCTTDGFCQRSTNL
jgi:hypothetical protein